MKLKPLRSLKETLKYTTVREFGGGLNVVDNDLNLDSKFATVLTNMYRGQDGSMSIRYGTELFATLDADLDEIIGIWYYNANLIAVGRNGKVAAIAGNGLYNVIFSAEIAAEFPGSPGGWDETNYVSFCDANGYLIIANGTNKPLVVDPDLTCGYLVDAATGSNLFVPVARHVSVHDRYVVMSGDPFQPDVLFISSRDTIGTFQGAPPPNDGVNISLGSRVRQGSNVIRAHASFRDRFVVFFDETIVIGTLGIYDSGNHTPLFDDAIQQYGAKNHNTVQAIGDDMFFADLFGVPSLSRALFTGDIKPDRASALIDPAITAALDNLNDAALEDRVFAIYNINENQYMLFVPNDQNESATTETICFAYTIARQSKDRPWSIFRGWNWRCGCRSAAGNVFFCSGANVFLYGNQTNPVFGDMNEYEDTWDDLTAFDDGRGFDVPEDISTYEEARTGVPVRFDWQLPWADFGKRMINKFSKAIALDTFGEARYNVDMFVDNLVIDRSNAGEAWTDETIFDDGTGWIPLYETPYIPALSMEFVGGDFLGYGGSPYGLQFGGGRPTPEEMLYMWESKFKIAKFRIHGADREQLRVVSLSIAYADGSIRR